MTRSDAAFWGRFRVMLGRDRFRDRFRARDRGGRGVVGRGERSFSFWPATVHGQRAGTGEGSRLAASVHRVNVTLETRGVARGDPSLLARAWEKVFERRKRGAEARPKRDRKGAASVQDRPHRTTASRVLASPPCCDGWRPSRAFGAAREFVASFRFGVATRDGARDGPREFAASGRV